MCEQLKNTKICVCESTQVASKSRVLDQRIRTLISCIQLRELLGDTVSKVEIPDDIADVIFNLKTNI